ncbi:MAG: arylsulfatase [Blastopirellula sp.]|nr:MAG: arylsulfatase [Blastopirellula sp.]
MFPTSTQSSYPIIAMNYLPLRTARLTIFLFTLMMVVCKTHLVNAESSSPPNIVFIISDDMGYSDLGCYGGELNTPTLDSLAADGVRFTNYYCENMCMATRAAILSGVYTNTSYQKKELRKDLITIPNVLKQAGYHTAMSGKWHQSKLGDTAGLPTRRGFDRYYGTINGAGSFFAPSSLMRNEKLIEEEFLEKDFYYTDAITDNAVKFIEECDAETPLFLYVAYTAAHWPLHARDADIKKFVGKFDAGWDNLREARFKRMQKLGILPEHSKLSPRDAGVPAWEAEEHKAWQLRRMEVYAAQVDVMDQGIARIVDSLKATGRYENTLLMFTIDNGGCHVEYGPDRKGAYLPEKTRDGRPVVPGNLPHIMPGPEDTYQSYGRGWANLSNTPYRLFKTFSHEGGIRVPLIVHWPKIIQQGGQLNTEMIHAIDFMPTFADLAGTQLPKKYQGKPIVAIDGSSFATLLKGEDFKGREAMFFRWNKGKAVRQGNWKLVQEKGKPWELYNLAKDPSELKDLSKKLPKQFATLQKLWEDWYRTSLMK